MAHAKAESATKAPENAPPDIATMRASVRRALTESPQPDGVDTLAATLRGHIEVLIPEVEALAGKHPKTDVPRICALACVGEARGKLRAANGHTAAVRLAMVEKLGRSVNALCDHFENLGGPR